MDAFAQKSLLAKLMATENLFIRQGNVATASFDVQNRVLTVPVLNRNISKDLYDLFMGHECGHALWTSYAGMKKANDDKINMSVLNVVEDSRIERKIKNKYPGIRTPFIKGYSELYEQNFFETQGKNLEDYNFIDRVNLHCKIGATLAFHFNAEEKALLDLVESTETFEDAVEVTKKICEYMAEQSESLPIVQETLVIVEGEGEDAEESDVEIDGVEGNNKSDNKESSPEGEPDEQSDESGSDGEENSPKEESNSKEASTGPKAGRHLKGGQDIRSETDDAFRKNEHNLFEKGRNNYLYVNVQIGRAHV